MRLTALSKALFAALFALAIALLVGCGQKGPLYQPLAETTMGIGE